MSRLAALVGLVLLVAVAGCGEDSSVGTVTSSDSGIEHVHGLGVDPADDSLVIATHTGLFRSQAGTQTAERIGDRRQDTMGLHGRRATALSRLGASRPARRAAAAAGPHPLARWWLELGPRLPAG